MKHSGLHQGDGGEGEKVDELKRYKVKLLDPNDKLNLWGNESNIKDKS